MKEKILAFLKTKLKGVQNVYLEGVAERYSKTITEESQIETTLTDGVIEVLKYSADTIQSEGDSRATEATKTAVSNYEKKHSLKDGKPAQKTDTQPTDGEPEWFKNYREKRDQEFEDLKSKIETKEQKETQSTLRQRVIDKLTDGKSDKEKSILTSWLDGRTIEIEKEEDIDTVVGKMSDGYTAFKQVITDSGVELDIPGGGDGDSSSLETQLDNWTREENEE